jgi:hypothetical protein
MTYCQQQTAALLIESKLLKRISGLKRDEAGYWNNIDYTERNTTVCSHVYIRFTEVGKLFQTQPAVIICTIRAKKGEAFGGKFTELVIKKTQEKRPLGRSRLRVDSGALNKRWTLRVITELHNVLNHSNIILSLHEDGFEHGEISPKVLV